METTTTFMFTSIFICFCVAQTMNKRKAGIRVIIFTPHVKLQIYLSCANGMRNILTYEFLIRLHKDTIWDKRLFLLNSHVHTIRGKIKYQARRIQRVCVRRGPGVFTVTEMPVGEGAIHRDNTPRSISTQARPAPLHIKNIGHEHTHCIQACKNIPPLPPSHIPTTYIRLDLTRMFVITVIRFMLVDLSNRKHNSGVTTFP